MNIETASPVSTETENKLSRKPAMQDRRISDLITATKQVIEQVQMHTDISAALTDAGYNTDRFLEGVQLSDLAQTYFNRRQTCLAVKEQTAQDLNSFQEETIHSYADFRVIARALFRVPADRIELNIKGRIPYDRQQLITGAYTSYAAARRQPYQEVLSRHGYGPERLDKLEEQLRTCQSLDNSQDIAAIKAMESTKIRDEAVRNLHRWYGSFLAIAKRTVRENPEWLKLLEL